MDDKSGPSINKKRESGVSQNTTGAQTPEMEAALVVAFRESIIKFAVDQNLNFNVAFAALAQVTVGFLFDFVMLSGEQLTEETARAAVKQFSEQLENTAKVGLTNVQKEASAVTDVTPKIITEI